MTAGQRRSRARSAAARLGRVGAWSFGLDGLPVAEAVKVARAVEDLGFGSLWIAEGTASREALCHAAVLLCGTSHVVLQPLGAATGAKEAIEQFTRLAAVLGRIH